MLKTVSYLVVSGAHASLLPVAFKANHLNSG
jgi:hypothetical protein